MLSRQGSERREVPRILSWQKRCACLLVCYSTLAHAFKHRAPKQLYVLKRLPI